MLRKTFTNATANDVSVLLCHATGFCKEVWVPFISALSSQLNQNNVVFSDMGEVEVTAFDFTGHGSNSLEKKDYAVSNDTVDWSIFSQDISSVHNKLEANDFMSKKQPTTVGVGHSMGATALLLSELQQPGTFSELVLFEPIVFPPRPSPMTPAMEFLLSQLKQSPLARSAKNRRGSFTSKKNATLKDFQTELIEYFSSKSVFQNWDKAALKCYVEGGFHITKVPGEAGKLLAKLHCDPRFEANIYSSDITMLKIWENLSEITCPVTVVAGRNSVHLDQLAVHYPNLKDINTTGIYKSMSNSLKGSFVGINSGHFIPMESPVASATVVANVIERIS